ncbi:unannotated protein [freshwater metagenome]|uniref:Unannotated protein n=1 Tax=freshwater metagenome TaxID=449393 RepID=A0A6J7BC66_9ZZZZ
MDLISGPKTASTPRPSERRNLFQGSTASLTLIPLAIASPAAGSNPSDLNSEIEEPNEMRAAALANGTPVALLTNGTVRDARGFASNT